MTRKILKPFLYILIVAALCVAAFFGYRYVTAPKALDLATLRTETVRRGDVLNTVHATGKVAGIAEVSLFLDATQKVAAVHVREGARVRAGDVLVSYDISRERDELLRREREILLSIHSMELTLEGLLMPASGNELLQYQSDVEQAEKSVADALADLEAQHIRIEQQRIKLADAERTVERNRVLQVGGVISERELEFSETQLTDQRDILENMLIQSETRERALAQRQAHLRDATARLRNVRNPGRDPSVALKQAQQENSIALSEIELERVRDELSRLVEYTVSPMDAYVSELPLKAGQTAPRGSLVALLGDPVDLMVKTEINEFDAPKITPGLDARVSTQGLPGVYFPGVLVKIAASATEKDGSDDVIVPMEVLLVGDTVPLVPGFSVDVEIILEQALDVLFVPVSALALAESSPIVYVIVDDTLVARPVIVGLQAGRMAEIVEGLQEGEVIVVDAGGV
jgi:multidrug efflux pump subunit AcrA (membrane-fusion protein)